MSCHQCSCPTELPQHIIQCSNNRCICFASDEDFAAYAHWLHEYSVKFNVDIHAWVFMTNHAHLLATPSTDNGIALMIQVLGLRYVQYFNVTYHRSGTLWEGLYKLSTIDTERYLFVCYRYIELNPVRANMVDDPANYKWSSYHCNALGVELSLCTLHEKYLCLEQTIDERRAYYRGLF